MLVLLFSLLVLTYAQTIVPVRIVTPDLSASLLDPVTGDATCSAPLPLPNPDSGCKWKMPLVGTRGQTSTVFYVNQTLFFTGQEVCETGIRKTIVWGLMGPFCWNGNASMTIYPLYEIDPSIALTDLNMAWDHTCNVVVLQPQYLSNGTLIQTKQVSEYDGAVRPQVDYEFDPLPCDTFCWQKVNGFGGLDFGSYNSVWNPELNCGDTCIFYTLEEKVINSQPVFPRVVIGRSFRTHSLVLNITDSVQALTMSWNPFANQGYNQFLGIGICCTHSWCHPACKGLDSHMVIFSFNPYDAGNQFKILADIGATFDPDTSRLGIEYNPLFSSGPTQVYVFYQESVISFNTQSDSNGMVLSVTKSSQSPKINKEIVVWSFGMLN